MKIHIGYAAVALILGALLGWTLRTPQPTPPCEFTQQDIDSVQNAATEWRTKYLQDSAVTALLKHQKDSLEQLRTPTKDRVTHAKKALHSASLDTLQRIILRPIE